MASQQWSFTGPKAPRSKHVVSEMWEKHKAEIKDLYEKNSLEEVMLHMKRSKDFSPSKRQYIYQFEKWGLQKYNKTNNATSDTKILDLSASSSDTVTELSGCGQESLSHSQLVAPSVKRKCAELEQCEKRPKLSDVEDKSEHHLSELQAQVLQPTLPLEMPICLLEGEDLTVAKAELEDSNNNRGTLAEACPKIDQQGSSDDSLLESKLPLLQLDGPNLGQLLHTLSTIQMDNIIAAADFLAASQCPDEAFLLFFLLLARHQARKDVPQQMLECALIGCTRNASYKWHVSATTTMLKAHVNDLSLQDHTDKGLQAAVYSRLMEEVLTKKDPKHHTIRPSRLTAKTVWPEYSLFEAPDDRKPLVLEKAYQSNKSGRQISSGAGVDQAGITEPIWVHMIEVLEIANVIRQFLHWCQCKLRRKTFLQKTSSWRLADASRAYYLALYHGLSQAYLEDDKDMLKSNAPQWTKLCRTGMGLSPPRFLANVALMLSKHAGVEIYCCTIDRLWNEQAIGTCSRLSSCSDKVLVYEFLCQHYLISSGTLGSSNFELRWYENQYRPLIKDQVKTLLGIYLPSDHRVAVLWHSQLPKVPSKHRVLEERNVNDSASGTREKDVPKEVTLPDCTPTLAGPLPPSEYRSLEALRDQFKGVSKEGTGHKEATTSSSVRSQSPWSRLTSDSWSLSRYISGRGSPTGSQSSWSRLTSDSWSLSRYLPGRRSRLSATVIESIITDCSRISINTNEPEIDGASESLVTAYPPLVAEWV